MKKLALTAALGLFAGALAFGGETALAAEQQFVSIGTGGVTGVYYPTGGAICRLVNKDRREHGIRCSVESTGGSIYNINTIRAGELEFGVAQSDWQYHAFHGTSKFEEAGPFEGLRAVFSVHAEPVTILARDDSEVQNITDLKGKRLNIGNPGSGTRGTWDVIEEALGWTRDDLRLAAELKSSETGQALCDDKIDAYFWLVGHPSALTEETLSSCDAHLVNATGEAIERHHHLRRGRDLRDLHRRVRRSGLCRCQGGAVEPRRFPFAAPGLRQSEGRGDDFRQPVGSAP
jgi:TRAP transporter TAXI family solute receptor